MSDKYFMQKAIELSVKAVEQGNEPFGAVLVKNNEIVYVNQNQIYTKKTRVAAKNSLGSSLAAKAEKLT